MSKPAPSPMCLSCLLVLPALWTCQAHGASPVAPVPARAALAADTLLPEALQEDSAWFLKGGLITGGFVGARAQQDWPLWMQALLGNRPGVAPQELRKADLAKIPDARLVQAIRLLTANRVFEPRILRQATGIGYTSRAAEWQEARIAYQLAYLEAQGLPLKDPLTASRMLTQLAYHNDFDALRRCLAATPLAADVRDSFLRLLALREGRQAASAAWVLDRTRPAAERLAVLTSLKDPKDPEVLLAAFRETDQLDRAVYHAVTRAWIPLDAPAVDAAIWMRKQPEGNPLWFMVAPGERVSDLLWMRAMSALRQERRAEAVTCAKALLEGFPGSALAGHAGYLLTALEPSFPLPAQANLRVPADVTLFNARRLKAQLEPQAGNWPEPLGALAIRNRFDLILSRTDPGREEGLFLRAAFQAGQEDLVARYEATERRCVPGNLPFLYPVKLAPLVGRLIREEGLSGLVDTAFVLAMIKNESLFQPDARSGAEAFGIMQLLRPTFRRLVDRDADIMDPETNIRAGLRYYRTVIRAASLEGLPEEVRLLYVLAGYHAGEGRARRWRQATEEKLGGRVEPVETLLRVDAVPIDSTRQYILHVLGDRELFKAYLE